MSIEDLIVSTETRKRSDYDPCGECPKGQCDNCDGCKWAASFDDNDSEAPPPDGREDY